MLNIINEWNESIKKFQQKMMQKKIDKMIKKDSR